MRVDERQPFEEGSTGARSVLPLLEESDVEVIDGELVPRWAPRTGVDDR